MSADRPSYRRNDGVVTRAFSRFLVVHRRVPIPHCLNDYLAAGALAQGWVSTPSASSRRLPPTWGFRWPWCKSTTSAQLSPSSTSSPTLSFLLPTLPGQGGFAALQDLLQSLSIIRLCCRPELKSLLSQRINVNYVPRPPPPFSWWICFAVNILIPGSFTSATTLGLIYSEGHPSSGIGTTPGSLSLVASRPCQTYRLLPMLPERPLLVLISMAFLAHRPLASRETVCKILPCLLLARTYGANEMNASSSTSTV